MQFKILSFLVALPLALADLSITSPASGDKVSATSGTITIKVTGADSYTSFQAFLWAGGNNIGTDSVNLAPGTPGPLSNGAITITGVKPAAIPSSGTTNAFYIQILATLSTGGQDTYYSNRFSVSGGSGAWPNTNMQSAAAALANTPASVPQDQKAAAAAPAANGAGAAAVSGPVGAYAGKGDPHPTGSWTPYSMQTGLTKYAPMQGKPGPSITNSITTPMYPTSAWSIFTTAGPIAKQVTTLIPSNLIFVVSSSENHASAATETPSPKDDMAKFLARWKD